MNIPSPLLQHISIVLVDTKTPANIGAVARCMMNTGLSRLILVNPPDHLGSDAVRLAAGAQDLLQKAEVYPSLEQAVFDHGLVVGASRHAGRLRKNIRSPREMAESSAPLLTRNRVALVFGNEVNGLENSDLALCQEIVSIPASSAFPSLNLSHAVMIVAYEMFLAVSEQVPVETLLAPAQDLENLYRHFRKTLMDIQFLDSEHPDRMMFALRQILGRARLDSREVSILRGILREIDRTGKK